MDRSSQPNRRRGPTRQRFRPRRAPRRLIDGVSGAERTTATAVSFISGPRHQPVPDRYFCTMEVSELGHIASAAAAATNWVFPLSAIAHPFNQVNGGNAIPNPLVAVATLSPAGLQNLLYNPTTNTGLWTFYRVWKAHYELSTQPSNGADDTVTVVSPVQSSATPPFANILTAQDSPGSKMVVCSQANPTRRNMVIGTVSPPQILGITPAGYQAMTTNTYGAYVNVPVETVYAYVTQNTMSNAVYTAICPLHITVRYEVEFFNRADIELIDA